MNADIIKTQFFIILSLTSKEGKFIFSFMIFRQSKKKNKLNFNITSS